MNWTLTNKGADPFQGGKNAARLTIETDTAEAQEILAAALKIADKPDPILEALKSSMGQTYLSPGTLRI